jgi:hypothetical protein
MRKNERTGNFTAAQHELTFVTFLPWMFERNA